MLRTCVRLLIVCQTSAWGLPAVAQWVAQTVPEPARLESSVLPDAQIIPATELHLEVFINGASTRLIVPVRRTADGRMLIESEELRGVGVLPVAHARQTDGWVDLSRLAGVQLRYDEAGQTLHLHAQNAAMVVRRFDVANRAQTTPQTAEPIDGASPPESAVPLGAFINHSVTLNTGGGRWDGVRRYQSASGLFEANVYGRFGVLTSAQLVRGIRPNPAYDGRAQRRWRTVRLDTTYSWYDEERLLTVSAGDVIGSSLSWSRAVRLGGIQVRRNFAIRPDLVTMPMLDNLSGSAAVPSTVELYINNAQRFTQDVTPGPFALTNLPPITGAGTARLVVRDALGREVVSETPFYATSDLLAQGLLDFAFEVGVARRNLGVRSSDYDRHPLAAATARYGLTRAMTLEGTLQGGKPAGGRLGLAGTGVVFTFGAFGAAGFSAAASQYTPRASSTERGAHFAAHLETEWRGIGLNARHQFSRGRFNDLASTTLELPRGTTATQALRARSDARPARRISQFSLHLPAYAFGSAAGGVSTWSTPSVGLSYTPMLQANGTRARLFGVNLGQRLPGKGWLSISAFRDLEQNNSGSVFAMFSWYFDQRLNASASVSTARGAPAQSTLELSQAESNAYGSVGWRVRSTQGLNHSIESKTQSASASYRHRYGRVEAGVEHMQTARGGQVNGRVQVDGALVLAGGGVFLANHIDDAFAIINVGAPDVAVLRENNRAGQTDARGQMLLTGLRAFEHNQIDIDPMSLPLDARIPVLRQSVRPRWRSGAVVDFGVTVQTRSALVTLTEASGKPLPVGTTVQLNDGAQTVVGYDGRVWFETVAERNRLAATLADGGRCIAQFSAPTTMTGRLVIPNAICRRNTP